MRWAVALLLPFLGAAVARDYGTGRNGMVPVGAAVGRNFQTGGGPRGPGGTPPHPIVIASKPFGESYLLAELFAQLLESRGFVVDRRLGLGQTEIAFGALRANAIDVYPEYTGTGLLAILGERGIPGAPAEVYDHVSRAFRERYGVRWLPPLGFENTYAIAVRRQTADSLGLRTLTDLARVGAGLRAGFTPDFIGRADGYVGLTRTYALTLRDVRPLLAAVKYKALDAGAVDVIDGYSTDGLLARYNLAVLTDDRRFFPPYEAAALVGSALQREVPAAVAVLTELSGRLDVVTMRQLNERVEARGEGVPEVARSALAGLGLTKTSTAATATTVSPARASLPAYLWSRRADIARMTGRHMLLAGVSLALAILVAVPLGLALERTRKSAEGVIRLVGAIQTVPGIALLAFMIPLFGIGAGPALVALFLYSLFPILRNTYTGVRDADSSAVNAAEALGMTPLQVLRQVRLPLAAPIIMAGVRTAGVINVGTATLAAFVGGGGLGDPIVAGLALSDTQMILSGAIPAAALALAVDVLLGACEHAVTPARR